MRKKTILLLFLLTVLFYKSENSSAQLVGTEQTATVQAFRGTFIVNGDHNTYYPVVFKYGDQNRINHLRIYRSYNEPGPNILSPTHKGGLSLEIDVNYGGWGGAVYDWRVEDLRQQYHTTFAGASLGMHYKGYIVWMRGGGFQYHYESEKPANIQVAYSTSELIYDSSNDQYDVYAPAPKTNIDWSVINAHKNDHWDYIKDKESVSGNTGLWTLVEEYGAVGDGTTNDAAAIQAAINSGKLISLSPKKTYLIKQGLTIGQYQTLNIPAGAILKFDATSTSFAAIYMDKNSTLSGNGRIVSSRFVYTATAWDLNNKKAAVSIIGWNANINFGDIWGFEYGISTGGNYPIAGCNIHVRSMYDNVIGILMYPTGSNGFVNQNYFQIDAMGGEFAAVKNQSYGIYMDYCPNNNHLVAWIENYGTGILLAGAFNRLEGLRLENCDTKIRIIGSETRSNNLFGEYGDIAGWSGKIVNQTGKPLQDVLQTYGIGGQTKLNDIWADNYYGLSDKSLKENIESVNGALNKILALRGTTYSMKSENEDESTKKSKKQYSHYGFIAQEMKEVVPELVKVNALDSLYAINYNGIIPLLVEAFKEQQEMIGQRDQDIEQLKEQNNELIEILREKGIIEDKEQEKFSEIALLYQNNPNPFNTETEIYYNIPYEFKEASILIMDMNGKLLNKKNIYAQGKNKVTVYANELHAGMYIYSMVCDGKVIGTKRMVLTQ